MIRLLLLLLTVGYALVPPGVCTCRFESWLLAETPACPDDHEDEDDVCVQIQQECVSETGPNVPDVSASDMTIAVPDRAIRPPFHYSDLEVSTCHWRDDSALYLTLRALLI